MLDAIDARRRRGRLRRARRPAPAGRVPRRDRRRGRALHDRRRRAGHRRQAGAPPSPRLRRRRRSATPTRWCATGGDQGGRARAHAARETEPARRRSRRPSPPSPVPQEVGRQARAADRIRLARRCRASSPRCDEETAELEAATRTGDRRGRRRASWATCCSRSPAWPGTSTAPPRWRCATRPSASALAASLGARPQPGRQRDRRSRRSSPANAIASGKAAKRSARRLQAARFDRPGGPW